MPELGFQVSGNAARIPERPGRSSDLVASARRRSARTTQVPCSDHLRPVCWHTTKRTTVKLPDELDALWRHEAQRRGTTVSELTREAIEAHLGRTVNGRRRLLAAGAGASGLSDVSERIEEILRAEVA